MQQLKSNSIVVYAALFACMSIPFVYYDYFGLLCAPPVGTHIWRQTDSLSFAWCYWKNGLDFFHPQILNRSFGNGYAVSEFPVLQYIIAILYSVFGFHWWISKAVYLFIYFSGLAALFKIANFYIKKIFWSFFISLLFFTAPSLVFYSNSCIPDPAALSFSFIGLSLFLSYQEKDKKYFYWLSMLFFCLAGLMKITYLLLFFSAFSAWFLLPSSDMPSRITFLKKHAGYILIIIAVNLLWYVWSDNYNRLNDHIYFLNKINPVWNESTQKGYIFKRTITEWALRFFSAPTNYLFLFSLLLVPFGWKKGSKFLSLSTLLLLFGSVAYYLLWYLQFLVHDYYTILFYALYLFAFLNMLILADIKFPQFLQSYTIKLMAIILLACNMIHVKSDLQMRYKEADLYPADKYLPDKGLVPYIRSIGIKDTDYVVVSTDGSPQIILCALQNPGFTEFCIGQYTPEKIKVMKKKGAKYLILIQKDIYGELTVNLGKPLGLYKEVTIYKL